MKAAFAFLVATFACVVSNGVTAIEWNFKKTGLVASREHPFVGGESQFQSLVTASEDDLKALLVIRPFQDIALPLPDGTLHTFTIQPSPIISKNLAAQFPRIRSYEGTTAATGFGSISAMKNEVISVVFSISTNQRGTELQAQYMSNKRGEMFLQPDKSSSDEGVATFRVASRDVVMSDESTVDGKFTCETEDGVESRRMLQESLLNSHQVEIENRRRELESANCNVSALGNFQCDPENNRAECNYDAGDCCGGFAERFAECVPGSDPSGCLCKDPEYLTVSPKTYRLAVGTTVEFSALYNFNREAVMAQIIHTFTRVAGVFRREVGVGFEIVYAHIETDEATRTIFGNENVFDVAEELPGVFDSAIGNDAYDLGHCFTTSPGGVAGGIGVTCNSLTKAKGVTGRSDGTGDIHFVDVVVHEMGHQMGSHHMFSGCVGHPGTPGFRVEPGSGTTFMSYASWCGGDNIEGRMSPYFHTLSLESIRRYASNPVGGAACGYRDAEHSTVDRPRVDPHISLLNPTVRTCSIPPSTPFRLSAVNAPVDEGYFYSWEQVDNTEDEEPNNLDDTPPLDGALFRSVPPRQNEPSRFFPDMPDYLDRLANDAQGNFHERLPPTPRQLEFVLGVRKSYVSRQTIDTTSFYLTDYSATYVGDSIKVAVADVEPLEVTDVTLEDEELTVRWTGGNLANKVRILGANPDEVEATFSMVVASSLDNNGFAQVAVDRSLICANFPQSQGRFVFAVESDEYVEGCSYFAASRMVIVECFDFTPPPTIPPGGQVVEFEHGPEDGNFTENGQDPEVPYDNDRVYLYTITAQPGKVVHLEFVEFMLEEGYDYVSVYDGDSESAPRLASFLSGTDGQGAQFQSSSSVMFIKFTTDVSVTAPGFKAEHYSVEALPTASPTISPITSATISPSHAPTIGTAPPPTGTGPPSTSSPTVSPVQAVEYNFQYGPGEGTFTENRMAPEEPYANNALYTYTITAQAGKNVLLEFLEFDLEDGWDFLFAYDGDSSQAPEIASYVTGTAGLELMLLSSGEKLYLEFRTDEIQTARGFVAQFSSVEPGSTPTMQPTPSPYVDEIYLTGSGIFNETFDSAMILYFDGLFETKEIEFLPPSYGVNVSTHVVSGQEGVYDEIVISSETKILRSVNGYLGIFLESENNTFPVQLVFKYTTLPAPPLEEFGEVIALEGPTREGVNSVVGDFSGQKYSRFHLNLTEPAIVSVTDQDRKEGVCVITTGNIQDSTYTYYDNLIAVIEPRNSTSKNFEQFLSEFPFQVPEPYPDFSYFGDFAPGAVMLNGPQFGSVSITCQWLQSIVVRTTVDPLLLNEPFTGTGVITHLNSEPFKSTQGPGRVFLLEPDGINESISIEFSVLPKDCEIFVLAGPLTNPFHGKFEGLLHQFPVGTTEIEPFVLSGAEEYSFALFYRGGDGEFPDFEVQYYTINDTTETGNFTAPLPGDILGDQLKTREPLAIREPFLIVSGTKPFGTMKNGLQERWNFIAPDGYKLKITFSVLDLEMSADYLHVYDGSHVDGIIQSFTGSFVPHSITSRGRQMMVRVVRDGSDDRQYLGVQAVVDVVKDDNADTWYFYLVGAVGALIVGGAVFVAYHVKKQPNREPTEEQEALERDPSLKLENGVISDELIAANPLFDANDL